MRKSLGLRFGVILAAILVAVGATCVLGGWTSIPELGLGLILGGVSAMCLGAILGPSGPPTIGHQRTGGAMPYQADVVAKAEHDDMRRSIKQQGPGLYAWLAAGIAALLAGVLLRML